MACRITELVLDAHHPEFLARFWCQVLGYVELEQLLAAGARRVDIGQTGGEPWHVLADPEGKEFGLLTQRVPHV